MSKDLQQSTVLKKNNSDSKEIGSLSFKNELEDEYLDNSFDNQIEEDMKTQIKKLEKTYEIL